MVRNSVVGRHASIAASCVLDGAVIGDLARRRRSRTVHHDHRAVA
ncbi:hypothetical protein [Streptomyces mesophilus]